MYFVHIENSFLCFRLPIQFFSHVVKFHPQWMNHKCTHKTETKAVHYSWYQIFFFVIWQSYPVTLKDIKIAKKRLLVKTKRRSHRKMQEWEISCDVCNVYILEGRRKALHSPDAAQSYRMCKSFNQKTLVGYHDDYEVTANKVVVAEIQPQ